MIRRICPTAQRGDVENWQARFWTLRAMVMRIAERAGVLKYRVRLDTEIQQLATISDPNAAAWCVLAPCR